MRAFWRVATPVFLFAVSILPKTTFAQSTTIEPQVVRLTYVEGDVRISSGGGGKTAVGQDWVQAQSGLPIEEGFDLSTGAGRAEIEFESGSVVYLADNSALSFPYLAVLNGVPSTDIVLLSGTATINVHPTKGETFRLETPSLNSIAVTNPDFAFLRIESFLDGMKVTLQDDTFATHNRLEGVHLVAGQTITYQGPNITAVSAASSSAPDEWDSWVKARLTRRQATMDAALKASGLSAPVPGLAELYQSGEFFDCAPYGACWQPSTAPSESQQTETKEPAAPVAQETPQTNAPVPANAPTKKPITITREYYQPCWTTIVAYTWDPKAKKWVETDYAQPNWTGPPVPIRPNWLHPYWDWALCGAGTWMHQGRGYVLVLRKKIHHHRPVRWVNVGGKVGFVPTSPKDEKGKPPHNLKYGLFVPTGKADRPLEMVTVDPKKEVKLLAEVPKSFRDFTTGMPKAERPDITQQFLDAKSATAAGVVAKDGQLKIAYDYKRQGFVEAKTNSGGHAGKPVLVATLRPDVGGTGAIRQLAERTNGSGSRIEYGASRSGGGYKGGGYSGSSGRSNGSTGGYSGRSSGGSEARSGGYSGGGGGGGGGRSGGGGGGGYSGGGGSSGGSGGSGGGSSRGK